MKIETFVEVHVDVPLRSEWRCDNVKYDNGWLRVIVRNHEAVIVMHGGEPTGSCLMVKPEALEAVMSAAAEEAWSEWQRVKGVKDG